MSSDRRRTLAALVLSLAGSGVPRDGLDGLKAPQPVADGRTARLAAVDELSCTPCHRAVADEWASSLHALAWVDELYQAELADTKKPEGCAGCHAPVPLDGTDPAQKPPPRDGARHLGVDCAACHLSQDRAILGPFGAATDAHRSLKDPRFGGERRDALCATCHRTNVGPVLGLAKDFELTEQAAKGRSCVGCHMAPIERAAANAPPGAEPREHALRAGRSHALQTPRDPSFLARAFELRARSINGRTEVELANVAGHRVPGLVGRRLTITATLLDAAGSPGASRTVEIDHRAFVPVDEALTIALDGAAASVRVTGLHHDPRLDRPVEFLSLDVPVDAGH
jgi:nitrate/TMAO reductase-like tetraheme cytochrome c subunit